MSWLTVAVNQIRSAASLTNAYVATTTVDCKNLNQLTFLTNFTLGALTSMSWKVQQSGDGTNWYDQEIDDTANGAVVSNEYQAPARTLTRLFEASCALAITVPVKAPYVRVMVKGNTTDSTSSCDISVCYGVG